MLTLSRHTCLAFFLFLTACGTQANALPDGGPGNDAGVRSVAIGLNEVSVLFPLPSGSADANVLRFDTSANGGTLLSEANFDAIEFFRSDSPESPSLTPYGSWRVVAARIDPCFPSLDLLESNPTACRRQLRLVAQPLDDEEGVVGFQDAAIHLLYDLSEADFRALATAWIDLGGEDARDGDEPLGVSPRMQSEGLAGPYAQGIRALIVAYAGQATLTQFTFMIGRFVSWDFGGLRVTPSGLARVQIHGLSEPNAPVQTTTTDSGSDTPFNISPSSAESQGLAPLAGRIEVQEGGPVGSTELILDAPLEEMNMALRLSLDIDNPTSSFNADSLDCASCHIAGRVRERASHLGVSNAGMPRYENANYNLALVDAPRHASQQRAFGYRGPQPIFNQRTVNESAAVADALVELLEL